MPASGKVITLFVATSHREVIPEGLRRASEVQMLVVSGPGDTELPDIVKSDWIACCRTPVDAAVATTLTSIRDKGMPILGIGVSQSTFTNLILSPESPQQVFISALGLLRSLPQHVISHDSGALADLNIDDIITLFDRATNMRTPGSHERSDRVLWLVIQVARQLNLSNLELQELTAATRLREIGKIGLPDHLLYGDRAALPKEGTKFYENYAALGASILRSVPDLLQISGIVGYQLENVDGSGPSGMINSTIPTGARILRVCSAYERIEAKLGPENTAEILAGLWKDVNRFYDANILAALDSIVSKRELHDAAQGARITIDELRPGMILGQNVYSPVGVRMLAYGALVTAAKIRVLMEYLKENGQNSVIVLPRVLSQGALNSTTNSI